MADIKAPDKEKREKLQEAIRSQAMAEAATLGPAAKQTNVIIDGKQLGSDPTEETEGARLIQEVVARTAETAGDATATAAVLGGSLMCNSLQEISAGADPLKLKKGMEEGLLDFTDFLQEISLPVSSPAQLSTVATTAANGDSAIGRLVSEAFEKVGQQGVIEVKPSAGTEAKVQLHESTTLNTRFFCPYCSSQPDMQRVVYEEPLLLLTNHRTISSTSLLPLLDKLPSTKRPILIITDAVEGKGLPAFIINHFRGLVKVSFLRTPQVSGRGTDEILEDLALLTGGRMKNSTKGHRIEDARLSDLGSAGKLEVTKDFTSIIDGQGSRKEIEKKKRHLEALLNKSKDEVQKKQLNERRTLLSGGEATLFLPAASPESYAVNKIKAEAAVLASRAALTNGMVAGGGLAFLRGYKAQSVNSTREPDEVKGFELFQQALLAPSIQLAENSGLKGSALVNEALKEPEGFGYNAESGKFEPLLQSGIADACSMLLAATRNAVSVTGKMLAAHHSSNEVAV